MPDPSKALVVKLSSLGDLFHALPAVHALKRGLNLSVDWVTQPEYAELVGCFEDVDRVLTYPRQAFFRSWPAWRASLRAEAYSYIFDFQGLFKSGFTGFIARGGRRIGPSYARECAAVFYHEVAGRTNKDRHAVDEAMDFARHFDLPESDIRFPVRFPDFAIDGQGPRIAFVPRSRWPTKNWPPEHFSYLIRRLYEAKGSTAYVLGGSADRDVCKEIAREAGVPAANYAGHTRLVELGGLLAQMDLVITVDSGPMHMAAALGVPVLAVFGATDPKRTGPYGVTHRVVYHADLPCRPCRSRMCRHAGRRTACMVDLLPERVLERALQMLE